MFWLDRILLSPWTKPSNLFVRKQLFKYFIANWLYCNCACWSSPFWSQVSMREFQLQSKHTQGTAWEQDPSWPYRLKSCRWGGEWPFVFDHLNLKVSFPGSVILLVYKFYTRTGFGSIKIRLFVAGGINSGLYTVCSAGATTPTDVSRELA